MKRLIVLLVCIFAALLTLSSCGEKYKPVESTKEESKVIYTMKIDGVNYEVKYELYRMLFLSNKALVDGGDDSVWTSDKKDVYIARMNKLIQDRAAEIYSVFAFARSLDINPYSVGVNEQITEFVRISVEGNQADIQGHGTYEKFLASLKERNMNYSVMELLLRYSILRSYIYEKYEGVTDEVLGQLPGDIEISREDVSKYYFSDECVRVLQMVSEDREKMVKHRSEIINLGKDELLIARYIINHSTALATDCIADKKVSGVMIGKYAYDANTFGEYANVAFDLSAGETSDIIEVEGEGYYVAYKLIKSEAHFDRCYDSIRQSYINNEVGRKIAQTKVLLLSSLEVKEYSSIDHSAISMK